MIQVIIKTQCHTIMKTNLNISSPINSSLQHKIHLQNLHLDFNPQEKSMLCIYTLVTKEAQSLRKGDGKMGLGEIEPTTIKTPRTCV